MVNRIQEILDQITNTVPLQSGEFGERKSQTDRELIANLFVVAFS